MVHTLEQGPTVAAGASLKDVIVEITRNRLGACVVTNDQDQIIGIITDGDLRRMLQNEREPLNLVAKDIMTPNPIGISVNMLAKDALYEMNKRKITQLLVFNHEQEFVGIVHIHDLITLGLQ